LFAIGSAWNSSAEVDEARTVAVTTDTPNVSRQGASDDGEITQLLTRWRPGAVPLMTAITCAASSELPAMHPRRINAGDGRAAR
jgi:hypothetical protein